MCSGPKSLYCRSPLIHRRLVPLLLYLPLLANVKALMPRARSISFLQLEHLWFNFWPHTTDNGFFFLSCHRPSPKYIVIWPAYKAHFFLAVKKANIFIFKEPLLRNLFSYFSCFFAKHFCCRLSSAPIGIFKKPSYFVLKFA